MKERPAVWLLLLLSTVFLQWLGGAYAGGWGGHPDEPAHVMTGLMVRDYLAAKCPWPPMRFAEQYYVHYPKIALGHWPPFFYVVSALWMLLAPPTRFSLVLLMAAIGASIAAILYEFLREEVGRCTALAFALLMTTIPLMQQCASWVMPDALVALLCLAATWVYARYLESGRLRSAVVFGALAGLALITKGTGIVLAAVPLLVVAAGRRWDLPRKWSFWAPVPVVIAVAGPWYAYQFAAFPDTSVGWAGIAKPDAQVKFAPLAPLEAVGWLLVCLAAIGLVGRWFRAATPRWAALGSLAVASCAMPFFVFAMREPRHMLVVVPPLLALAAGGAGIIAGCGWFAWTPRVVWKRLGLMTVIVLAYFATVFRIPAVPPAALGDVARLILAQPSSGIDRVLISSDASGEGDMIVELAIREKRPGHTVLRASKMLSQSEWDGSEYRLLFSRPAEMQTELDKLAVRWLVVDSRGSSGLVPHHAILKEMVASSPDVWLLAGRFAGATREATVYRRAAHASLSHQAIEIQLPETLHRTLREELGGRQRGTSRVPRD